MYNYVFIRKDIPIADQIVQVGHVCLEAGSKFGPANSPSLVLLEVRDSQHLQEVKEYLDSKLIDFVVFYEPDDNMGETAICTTYVDKRERKHFKHYTLWKSN